MTTTSESIFITPEVTGLDTDLEVVIDDRHEWATYRLAATEYLAATKDILFLDGTTVVRTKWAEVTLSSTSPAIVRLNGEIGPPANTRLHVGWEQGPVNVRLRCTSID